MNIFITNIFIAKLKIILPFSFWHWLQYMTCVYVGLSCLLFSSAEFQYACFGMFWYYNFLPMCLYMFVCRMCLTIPKISYNKFEWLTKKKTWFSIYVYKKPVCLNFQCFSMNYIFRLTSHSTGLKLCSLHELIAFLSRLGCQRQIKIANSVSPYS